MNEFNKDLKILIVDDFASMRRIIRHVLSQINIRNVDEAGNGESALSLMGRNSYDIILADWCMPKMSGYELLNIIKNDENMKRIPVIMITAEAIKENIITAIQAGISDYIIKPFTSDVIKIKIMKILNGRK